MPVTLLCIAPMIQWSDRYWRYLMRLITAKTLLYTEMTIDNTIVYKKSNLDNFLGHHTEEYPLALQLGRNCYYVCCWLYCLFWFYYVIIAIEITMFKVISTLLVLEVLC